MQFQRLSEEFKIAPPQRWTRKYDLLVLVPALMLLVFGLLFVSVAHFDAPWPVRFGLPVVFPLLTCAIAVWNARIFGAVTVEITPTMLRVARPSGKVDAVLWGDVDKAWVTRSGIAFQPRGHRAVHVIMDGMEDRERRQLIDLVTDFRRQLGQ